MDTLEISPRTRAEGEAIISGILQESLSGSTLPDPGRVSQDHDGSARPQGLPPLAAHGGPRKMESSSSDALGVIPLSAYHSPNTVGDGLQRPTLPPASLAAARALGSAREHHEQRERNLRRLSSGSEAGSGVVTHESGRGSGPRVIAPDSRRGSRETGLRLTLEPRALPTPQVSASVHLGGTSSSSDPTAAAMSRLLKGGAGSDSARPTERRARDAAGAAIAPPSSESLDVDLGEAFESFCAAGDAPQVQEEELTSSAPTANSTTTGTVPGLLAALRSDLEGGTARVDGWAAEFESAVASDEIVVGIIPEAELRAREAAIAAARAAEEEAIVRRIAQQEQSLQLREAAARSRVAADRDAALQRQAQAAAAAAEAAEARAAALQRDFHAAEETLRVRLAEQAAEVKSRFGTLQSDRAGLRQLRVDWARQPQPIEVRLHRIRAVRNKLPSGRYVLLLTLYDRLGGSPLRWTRVGLGGGAGGPNRPGATTPVRHRGRFYDTELPLGQAVFAVCPPQVDIRPGYALVFELFLLGTRSAPLDCVVGWAAMPACDADFRVVSGRFRLPLLRGEVDRSLTQYRALETAMARDVDAWLANLYFEVVLLPREARTGGSGGGGPAAVRREFDVEVAYTSDLLRIRSHFREPVAFAGAGGRGDRGASEAAPLLSSPMSPGGRSPRRHSLDGGRAARARPLRRRSAAAAASAFGGRGWGGGASSPMSPGGARPPQGSRPPGDAGGGGEDEDEEGEEEDEEEGAEFDDAGEDLDELLLRHTDGPAGGWYDAVAAEAEDSYTGQPPVVDDRVTHGQVVAALGGASGRQRPAAGGHPALVQQQLTSGAALSSPSASHWHAQQPPRVAAAASRASYWRNKAAGGTGTAMRSVAAAQQMRLELRPPALGSPAAAAAAPAAAGGRGGAAALSRRSLPQSSLAAAAAAAAASASRVGRGGGGAWGGRPASASAARPLLSPHPSGAPAPGSSAGAVATGGYPGAAADWRAAAGRAGGRGRGAAAAPSQSRPRLDIAAASPSAPAAAPSATAHHGSGGGGGSSFGYAVFRQERRGLGGGGGGGARVTESVRKLRYLHAELLADLRPASLRTFEFWVQALLLLVALWLRVYLHYLGQYLFLKSLRVPVYSYDALPYAATVKYVPDALPQEMELGVVAVGPAFVAGVFAGLVAMAAGTQGLLGSFPHIASRFVAFYGLGAVLDPLLILLVDAAAGRYGCAARYAACAVNAAASDCPCTEGDAWILYRRFQSDQGSGVVGAVLTALVYVVVMMLASVLLYIFLLHVHLDGRMLDLYRRVQAPEDRFFVPHDFEVSAAELLWVVEGARRWKGPRGGTRKVAVCDYVLTDPLDPAFKETTSHLIIYNVSHDGSRELYRHFLRLPEGVIIEVFGALDRHMPGGGGAGGGALQQLLLSGGVGGAARPEDEGGAADIGRFFGAV